MSTRQTLDLTAPPPSPASLLRDALTPGTTIRYPPSPPLLSSHLIQIGAGLQAAIFSPPPTSSSHWALKRRHLRPRSPTNLPREYEIHNLVTRAFDAYVPATGCTVNVPSAFDFIPPSDPWSDGVFLPGYEQERTEMYRMERILPLPAPVRDALVAWYAAGGTDLRGGGEGNRDCLVRVYLGRQEKGVRFKEAGAPLRNLEMGLGELEGLGVDVQMLAGQMGRAYAIMQWGAGVDGDDVEVVLGSVFVQKEGNVQERRTELWMLDFGQCEVVDFEEEKEVVYQRFKGTLVTGDNQLFLPNCMRSKQVWKAFREGYVAAGKACLEGRGLEGKFDVDAFMDEYEEYAEDFL